LSRITDGSYDCNSEPVIYPGVRKGKKPKETCSWQLVDILVTRRINTATLLTYGRHRVIINKARNEIAPDQLANGWCCKRDVHLNEQCNDLLLYVYFAPFIIWYSKRGIMLSNYGRVYSIRCDTIYFTKISTKQPELYQ